jgi:phosphoserine phosphatase RsbU/P
MGRVTSAVLRAQVREIASGNLDARVEGVRTKDEIGELAMSFNQMAGELRHNLDRLASERASREKIENDLDIARDIQRGLLPTAPPNVPGFEVAGWNRAADKTGGDFFDWLELPDGRTIVTVADVTGHGIGPALIVAVCRAYLRASASAGHASPAAAATGETTADLASAVRRVNDLLMHDMPAGRFVTAVVGIIDAARFEMSLLSAGQAPIYFYEAAAGVVHTWAADGMPLGIMSGLELDPERVIRFAPGDTLVVATDGFFEWQDATGEQFGIQRLAELVRLHHALSPDALIEKIHEVVVAASGGTEQADDLTALVIRRAHATTSTRTEA